MAGLRSRPRSSGSRICTIGSIGERIGRGHHGDGTYRNQMVDSAHSRLPPSRTRSSRGQHVAVLNAIYEEEFLGFSYGFRPKRGQHDALDALIVGIDSTKGELHSGRGHPKFFDRSAKTG